MIPRWINVDRDYAATRRRLGIAGSLRQVLTGILPTYQLERNWPGDQLDLYGVDGITDTVIPGAVPLLISGSLHNVSDAFERDLQVELLVWRVTADIFTTSGVLLQNRTLQIFSPATGYNPELIPATGPAPFTGTFLPWLQPQTTAELLHFPSAGHLDMGYNPNPPDR